MRKSAWSTRSCIPPAPCRRLTDRTGAQCRGDPVGRPLGALDAGQRRRVLWDRRARSHQGDAPRRPYMPCVQPRALGQRTSQAPGRTGRRGGSRTAPTACRVALEPIVEWPGTRGVARIRARRDAICPGARHRRASAPRGNARGACTGKPETHGLPHGRSTVDRGTLEPSLEDDESRGMAAPRGNACCCLSVQVCCRHAGQRGGKRK